MEARKQENTYIENFLKENQDELEGIIQNEPNKNKYETVKYHKMNKFPYFLIGKVVSKFIIDDKNKFLNGVGILIGPSLVLTVAHNLVHMTENQILSTKKVAFFSSANGDFCLFDMVKSIKTFVPEEYIAALQKDDKDGQLLNDWGLIYLALPVGKSIIELLEKQNLPELKVEKGDFFHYFVNNKNIILDKLIEQTSSEKISIVGYTEYRESYKNNKAYKFLDNFSKKTKGNLLEDNNKNDDDSDDIPNTSYGKKNSSTTLNGMDYIILGEEDLNKDFDVTDAEKQIMSESKGKLIIGSDDKYKNSIMYKISTYKGQSGSPIFLRYKRISNSKKGAYVYHFVGLHSRRGPCKNFYESETMSGLLENLLTTNDVKIPAKGNQKGIIKSDEELPKKLNQENEIIALNGSCDYNLAVSIFGQIIPRIEEIATKDFAEIRKKDGDGKKEKLSTEFVYTKLILNDQVKLAGLFKRYVPLNVLFSFAAKIYKVPKEYILLRDLANSYGLSIQNYNYDHDKMLSVVMEDPEYSNSISFELSLNIKKYGEFLANNILLKFLENYDLEESQLKKDFKKYVKQLFGVIFMEINSFESIQLTYGLLFAKIRTMIFNKLGIKESTI